MSRIQLIAIPLQGRIRFDWI